VHDPIDQIEALIQQEVGRGATGLFAATRGGLKRAATALAGARPRQIGILTGFFVPRGAPPAAETDGPVGAALLAMAFSCLDIPCRVLTDQVCQSACEAAFQSVYPPVPIDAVAPDASLDPVIAAWREHGIDWVIAIERCGLSADGRPRNMRGEDVGAHTAALDHLFSAGPWRTIAIGDGGNEIGMGSLPGGLIAREIPLGATIACVTPADFLIAAGVSHWGAYGLIAGLALCHPERRAALLNVLDPEVDRTIVEALVQAGLAVDGVTLRRAPTIDGIDMMVHRAKLEAVRAIAREG
jgi:D-glutamate cyclase